MLKSEQGKFPRLSSCWQVDCASIYTMSTPSREVLETLLVMMSLATLSTYCASSPIFRI